MSHNELPHLGLSFLHKLSCFHFWSLAIQSAIGLRVKMDTQVSCFCFSFVTLLNSTIYKFHGFHEIHSYTLLVAVKLLKQLATEKYLR